MQIEIKDNLADIYQKEPVLIYTIGRAVMLFSLSFPFHYINSQLAVSDYKILALIGIYVPIFYFLISLVFDVVGYVGYNDQKKDLSFIFDKKAIDLKKIDRLTRYYNETVDEVLKIHIKSLFLKSTITLAEYESVESYSESSKEREKEDSIKSSVTKIQRESKEG